MMRGLSTRAWTFLMVALGLAVAVSSAGVVLVLNGGSTGTAAASGPGSAAAAPSGPQPGSAQARADLTQMQALLNSGSVSAQAALLVPGFQFAPRSGPVFPAGAKVTIEQATFRSAGQFARVQADVSGKPETLGLYSEQGHWRLYQVAAGTAQAQASVTGTASVQLMDAPAVQPAERACTPQMKITGTPVIFIHGFESSPAIWDSMFGEVYAMPGTWTSAFDYSGASTQWVTNSAIGPAFASYITCVAQASKAGGGPGKVIIIAHSMGGLATRWAATKGGAGQYIGTVITIGTPNTGSFLGNIGTGLYPLACSGSKSRLGVNIPLLASICAGENAEAGMKVFGPEISSLPELPSGIPLYAIAGNETILLTLGLASEIVPTLGDVAVLQSSALSPRGGSTFWCIALDTYQGSCWHNALPSNPGVEQKVRSIIQTYIASLPPPAPALGGLAYWLADGGRWYVHDEQLQLTQGPSGLIGTMTWNAGGAIITGHAQLALTLQPDGSLAGTFTTSATYTYSQQPLPAGFQTPTPADGPTAGQPYTLVPVAPMLAKVAGGYYSGNMCQTGLPNPSQYCGA
jgi:pimeloyl-ACP methyl ester carboxylesterase